MTGVSVAQDLRLIERDGLRYVWETNARTNQIVTTSDGFPRYQGVKYSNAVVDVPVCFNSYPPEKLQSEGWSGIYVPAG